MSFFNGVTPQSIEEADEGFKRFKIGENEAYVKFVIEKKSSNQNLMLEITFADEEEAEIKHYIVDNDYKLSKLKQFYIAFGISPQHYDIPENWLFAKGIVVCKLGKPNSKGNAYPEVSYLNPMNINNGNTVNRETVRPPMEPGYMTPQQGHVQSNYEFEGDIPF
jgi:hypothetical protein